MQEIKPALPVNRSAVISLAAGALTLLSFCTGLAPIPFTDFICYSVSLLFAVMALATGFASLLQIRRSGESGRPLAWIGISVGGLAVLAVVCILSVVASLVPSFEHYVQQAWLQLRH